MAIEIEEAFYEFRYSYLTEEGSLTVNYYCERIKNKEHMKVELAELRNTLKDLYKAKDPINITYKIRSK